WGKRRTGPDHRLAPRTRRESDRCRRERQDRRGRSYQRLDPRFAGQPLNHPGGTEMSTTSLTRRGDTSRARPTDLNALYVALAARSEMHVTSTSPGARRRGPEPTPAFKDRRQGKLVSATARLRSEWTSGRRCVEER